MPPQFQLGPQAELAIVVAHMLHTFRVQMRLSGVVEVLTFVFHCKKALPTMY